MSIICAGHIAHAVIRHLEEPFGTRETNLFPKQTANFVWNFLDSQPLFNMSSKLCRRLVAKQFFFVNIVACRGF